MPPPSPPRAFVHVGLPKTGTSYLQSLVWTNLDVLREQGVVVAPDPGPRGNAETSAQLMLALRNRLVAGEDAATSAEVLDRFAAEVRAAGDADVLVSQEQLAGCTRPQVRALFGLLEGHEVHVVVTARSLSRQVASAWQERVKTRSTTSFAEFVAAAQERGAAARGFWRNQDLPAVLERWGEGVAPERVHVVTVPAGDGSDGSLEERFFGVLGVDPGRLHPGWARSNSSLGTVQAELLRRVNVALGDRLPKPRLGYARVAKWYLTQNFLAPQRGAAPMLPESAEDWCRRLSEDWVSRIRAAGYDVVGDLDDLLPAGSHFTPGLPEVADAELLEAATRALADILVHREEELGRIDALQARLAELEAQVQEPGVSTARATSRRGTWRARVPWRGRR